MNEIKQAEAREYASKLRVVFEILELITESQSEDTSCPLIKATRTLYKNRKDVLTEKQEQVCLKCLWEECIETGDRSENDE